MRFLGARTLSLLPLTACFPFAELVSNMANERVLAITDSKDRGRTCFSVSLTFDANVKILSKPIRISFACTVPFSSDFSPFGYKFRRVPNLYYLYPT